jgi:hypothetical protein
VENLWNELASDFPPTERSPVALIVITACERQRTQETNLTIELQVTIAGLRPNKSDSLRS